MTIFNFTSFLYERNRKFNKSNFCQYINRKTRHTWSWTHRIEDVKAKIYGKSLTDSWKKLEDGNTLQDFSIQK